MEPDKDIWREERSEAFGMLIYFPVLIPVCIVAWWYALNGGFAPIRIIAWALALFTTIPAAGGVIGLLVLPIFIIYSKWNR